MHHTHDAEVDERPEKVSLERSEKRHCRANQQFVEVSCYYFIHQLL
jgi:hypothetical protein